MLGTLSCAYECTCIVMDCPGASSDSQDAHCPPPARPTSHGVARQPPIGPGAGPGSTPAPGVVSPSSQARQAFKFAAPTPASRSAVPPPGTTKRPGLPSVAANAVRPAAASALPPPRLRHFQAPSAQPVSRASVSARAPSTSGTTGTVARDRDEDDAGEKMDRVLLVGQGLELVTDVEAAGRYITATVPAGTGSSDRGVNAESPADTEPLEGGPTNYLDLGSRRSAAHNGFDDTSQLGPKSLRPSWPSHLRVGAHSPVHDSGPSENSPGAAYEAHKRTSDQLTTDEPVKKRQREGARHAVDEVTKQSPCVGAPRMVPVAFEPHRETAGKKSTSARPSTAERSKRASGNRQEPRSRPATSSASYDETIANLRRWQRHEAETVCVEFFVSS